MKACTACTRVIERFFSECNVQRHYTTKSLRLPSTLERRATKMQSTGVERPASQRLTSTTRCRMRTHFLFALHEVSHGAGLFTQPSTWLITDLCRGNPASSRQLKSSTRHLHMTVSAKGLRHFKWLECCANSTTLTVNAKSAAKEEMGCTTHRVCVQCRFREGVMIVLFNGHPAMKQAETGVNKHLRKHCKNMSTAMRATGM